MKKILLLIMAFISLSLQAQNVNVVKFSDGTQYVSIDVQPVSEEYQNVKIYLRGNKLEDFIYDLEQRNKKIKNWVKVAEKEHVTDMQKKMKGATQFSYMTLEYKGAPYYIEGAATFEGSFLTRNIFTGSSETGRPYCQSMFIIDKQGNCFLDFFSLMNPQKFHYGNISIESSSASVAVGADNHGNVAVGASASASSSQAVLTLKPEFHLLIPAANIQNLADQLQGYLEKFKDDKKDLKDKKKLFK
jgi:hypothetical protein